MLASGDLIFVSENTEMGQAIQASTGNYSHVAIFLDGSIYHATVEGLSLIHIYSLEFDFVVPPLHSCVGL